MKSFELFSESELPFGFVYPKQVNHIVKLGLVDLEPWHILEGKQLRNTMAGLTKRYPERKLIPFARRQDNDDIACWQANSNEDIFIIHDFASLGWEQRNQYASFHDWFRHAVEDLIDFDC